MAFSNDSGHALQQVRIRDLAATINNGVGSSLSQFAVVWLHGFGSHRGGEKSAAVLAECERRNWPFLAFDFRGHGESAGTIRELRASGLLEDLAKVCGFLASRGHTRVGLVGSSMGGFVAAWYATLNPDSVLGCVLLAPALGFLQRRWDRLTPEEREEWKRTDRLRVKNDWVDVEIGYGLIEEREQFRSDDLAKRWRTPALVFHGLADDVVPAEDILDFVQRAAYPGIELRLLKDGDHRLTAYKDEIAAAAGLFFAHRLEPRTPLPEV